VHSSFPQVVGFLLGLCIAGAAIYGLVVPKGNTVQDGWNVVNTDLDYVKKVRHVSAEPLRHLSCRRGLDW